MVMLELSLFTGAGGGILGTHLLGWRPVGYVEFNDYCQRVLAARIRDGFIPNAPIFGDVRAFLSDGYAEAYQGMVDVVTAGFPCQPFSRAGKLRGEDDPRNIWPATRDTIRIVRPRYAFLENVPGLLFESHGYFGRVLGDLAEMGCNVKWGIFSACSIGASHTRERLFVLADFDSHGFGAQQRYAGEMEKEANQTQKQVRASNVSSNTIKSRKSNPWETEPSVERMDNGVASAVDRLKALGNGQVPAVVRLAWETLSNA